MKFIKRLMCALDMHSWELTDDHAFCHWCGRVWRFTGTRHFELDICNSGWVEDSVLIFDPKEGE